MLVQLVRGNLFDSDAQALVNTVNCVGVMGKGITKAFKKRFPELFADYARRCEAGEVRLGEPYLFRRLLPPNVLNFPTKDHWRSDSKLEDIIAGLEYLHANYQEWGITSLAVPAFDCGNGQLKWLSLARFYTSIWTNLVFRLSCSRRLTYPFSSDRMVLERSLHN